jgi:2-polyprenyl-6-methoxyphenol hydroxylase-like FAD-dependent oxidoreductase
MTIPPFDRAILGAGPVGLIAAVQSAKTARTLLIMRVARRGSAFAKSAATPRVESVPAALVNLLLDFGVDPRLIGVDRLHEVRHAAWDSSDPATTRGRAVAHLDYAQLAAELLMIARCHPSLTVTVESQLPTRRNDLWAGASWRAHTLLDATGRSMAMSTRRVQPPKPWIARPFWRFASSTRSRHLSIDRCFRIAALPFGYTYRLGSNTTDMLWVVGRGKILSQSPALLDRTLRSCGAAWLLDGFGPLDTAGTGRSHPVSVQWSERSRCVAIGDAALARDILSSQGLSVGISDALYATAERTDDDAMLIAQRRSADRTAHLRSLQQVLDTCLYRDRPEWCAYANFLSIHQGSNFHSDRAVLNAGRIALEAKVSSLRGAISSSPLTASTSQY